MLEMLAQHRYLTTEQVASLFFPSLRTAQRRLKLMRRLGFVMRWRQIEPNWRKLSSLFLLTETGAGYVAAERGEQPDALVRRSWNAAERTWSLLHELEVNAFFVDLAELSRDMAGFGLYHWLSEDRMRSNVMQRDNRRPIAPDGWGRFLCPDREVLFHLEMDRGTEDARHLADKVAGYVHFYGSGSPEHVLFVAPTQQAEARIHQAIRRVPSGSTVRFWTTTRSLLDREGALAQVWTRGEDRVALSDFDGLPRGAREAVRSIGKPDWWLHRLGAGEGA